MILNSSEGKILHTMSSPMDLCQFCQNFAISLCGSLHQRTGFIDSVSDYFAPLDGMLERTRSCRLCHLVDYHLTKIRKDAARSFYSGTQLGILPERSRIEGNENTLTQIMICSTDNYPHLIMAVWASPGNVRTNRPSLPLLTINRYPCRRIGPHQL